VRAGLAAFDAVRDLPEAALRDLLDTGEPVERVWAAWALGLRLGGRAVGPLRTAVDADPDPGTRRHLVVALAGFGERGAVATLAAADPDPWVRATACQYLERLAAADVTLWPLVLARFGDPAPVVRETLVQQLATGAPAEIRAAALRCVEDEAPQVRQAVVERLDTLLDQGTPLPEWGKRQALVEPTRALRRALLSAWHQREGSACLLNAVARAGRFDLACEALEILADVEPQVAWPAVAELAEVADRESSRRIFVLFGRRLGDVPLPWLLRYLAGAGWYWDYTSALPELLPRLARSGSLAAADRAALSTLARRAGEQLAPGTDPWDDEDDPTGDDQGDWHAQLARLVAEARRLCGEDGDG
jgi:hypothetical protein